MFFKRFRFQVIVRVLLLGLSIFAFFYFLLQTGLYTASAATFIFIFFQVYALIRFLEKTNLELQRFFLAIEYEDFSRSFSGKELGPSFAGLISAFNDVIAKMQQTRSEREAHYRYLQTIVQHVGIGLITFAPDGEVSLINKAAKRLLQVGHLKNIDALTDFSKPLVEKLFALKAGEKSLVKIESQDMELVVRAADFRMHDRKYTLVSLENI
ncbi:MAG: ATP-binding protein, partial [Candidatus Aminicenantes bacterium]|nr:ATP-binding protein [Candidatus Aminicenantes bacterium]